MSFHHIEVELVLIGGSADRPFVHLVGHHTALRLFIIYYLRITHVVVRSDVHRVRLSLWITLVSDVLRLIATWLANLGVVTSGLRSPFYLVLNLLSLFFVRLSNRYALANLLLLRPIQRIHLVMRPHHEPLSTL